MPEISAIGLTTLHSSNLLCLRADRIGAAAVQADKVVAAASQCIGFERLHRLDKWAVKTLESVSHRIELLSRSQHPLAVKVRNSHFPVVRIRPFKGFTYQTEVDAVTCFLVC